jgi:hydroxypyruvate reductase
MNPEKSLLLNLFKIAVNESLPSVCMPKHLTSIDANKKVCILGAGKAAVDMAKTAYEYFGDNCYGAVVTRHGYTDVDNIGKIAILTAGHPIPDEGSHEAGKTILALAENTPIDVPVLFLISGGGSALLSLPIDGLAFEQKIKINQFLLRSGASIDEINCVRKQLSKIKGGRLGQAIKGQYQTLVISDVVGNDPSIIASGPTVTDISTAEQAIHILAKYQYQQLDMIQTLLKKQQQLQPVANKPDQALVIMADAQQSIDKAVFEAKKQGLECEVLSYVQEGEASEVAKQHAKVALAALAKGKPVLLLSGGELTVTLGDEDGQGGPNQEYMLALAVALNRAEGITAISCDTDGIDGNKDVAGAYIDETTLDRAIALSLDPRDYLKRHDCYNFFTQIDDLIITGPTHTNVNDFRVIMVTPK